MSDEEEQVPVQTPAPAPADPPVGAPIIPVESPPPVDAGIISWRSQLEKGIEVTPGVELIGSAGGSINFRFRGQSFVVTVYRTS